MHACSVLFGAAALTCALSFATPPHAAPRSPIQIAAFGNLTSFQAIASDALADATRGDLPTAEKRGTDLESAWDDAEGTLKPTDPVRWRVVDKAIDRVLAELRAPQPKQDAIIAALKDLVAIMNKGGAA